MPILIHCANCGREEVEQAPTIFTQHFPYHKDICVDCMIVGMKFFRKGLKAFRIELERLAAQKMQLDLFEQQNDDARAAEMVRRFLESL